MYGCAERRTDFSFFYLCASSLWARDESELFKVDNFLYGLFSDDSRVEGGEEKLR